MHAVAGGGGVLVGQEGGGGGAGLHALRLMRNQGLAHQVVEVLRVVEAVLRLPGNGQDGRHRQDRVLATQCFGTQQEGVCSVNHRIGHVGGLCPGGPGVAAHGVHQPGDDDWLAKDVAVGDHGLLDERHLLGHHIQAQVATAHDDAVAGGGNALEVKQRLPRLELGQDLSGIEANAVEVLAGGLHVITAAHEGQAQEVDLELRRNGLHVCLVSLC
mmetsp:Transcript_6339/g.18216  ORF Transcript_6339/g.18216 Transcript_6339/m.18216 type:complete len:215 (-) Transcript_6339:869-1513(-)